MYLGWFDPDKKKPVAEKLHDAIGCYRAKFGGEPSLCLTSSSDAAELGTETAIPVRAVSYIGRHTFYIGVEEASDLDLAG